MSILGGALPRQCEVNGDSALLCRAHLYSTTVCGDTVLSIISGSSPLWSFQLDQ